MSEEQMYLFEAVYHYQPGEKYSNGRGLSAFDSDLKQLETTFEVFKGRGEPYAMRITNPSTGQVIRMHGDIIAAIRSTQQAKGEA
jgi:hypothetical protein